VKDLPTLPVCWPDSMGACACGHGHVADEVGKAPLVRWSHLISEPPTTAQIVEWSTRWPGCNWAVLLEPAGWLVLDLDTLDALGEATASGMPPAPCWTTRRGRNYAYVAPDEVRGRRTTKRGNSHAIDILAGGLVTIPPSRHRLGVDYRWVVPPEIVPPGPAPRWAIGMLLEASDPSTAVPVVLPDNLAMIDVDSIKFSSRIRALILSGAAPEYASRSEAVFAVIQALIRGGYTDDAIASILTDCRYGISAKPLQHGRRWLAHEIARGRAKSPVTVI
jgi:hypothetical protein